MKYLLNSSSTNESILSVLIYCTVQALRGVYWNFRKYSYALSFQKLARKFIPLTCMFINQEAISLA